MKCAAGDIEGEVDRLKQKELNNLGARKRLAFTEDADDRGRRLVYWFQLDNVLSLSLGVKPGHDSSGLMLVYQVGAGP